ncbi:MAG: hypothetical protein HQM13_22590 [SAR324 cluster bacterium]|nr:hypothetical protein [SAR324 cluster bacterium]
MTLKDRQENTTYHSGKHRLSYRKLNSFLECFLIEAEPQKSLAYLFAPSMNASLMGGIWILSAVTLIFLPQKELHTYLFKNEAPVNFLIVSQFLLFGSAYLNMICGHGEFILEDKRSFNKNSISTWEESKNFFKYGLIKFLLHGFILLIPFLPFIMISAASTQMPWNEIVRGMTIIYSFSLLCRLLGFTTYLVWGQGLIGYYFVRLIVLIFLGSSFYFFDSINPFSQIYGLYQSSNEPVTTSKDSYTVYLSFMVIMSLLLSLFIQLLVQRNLPQE